MGICSLVALTFFIVSGGPYGLEELLSSAGYSTAIALLIVTPIMWSLPVALLVGELAGAYPEEGGYVAWVTRGLGPFWGFQEGWWSLAASVFDMAIYPTLLVTYLSMLFPILATHKMLVGGSLILGTALVNLSGPKTLGRGAIVATLVLLFPFVMFAFTTLVLGAGVVPLVQAGESAIAGSTVGTGVSWGAALSIVLWNYMGWDNASTFVTTVEKPNRTYPVGMMITVVLVTLTYLLPVVALRRRGVDVSRWQTGEWVLFLRTTMGKTFGVWVAAGGALGAAVTFNALTLSYSRLPLAMAQMKMFPRAFQRVNAAGVPILSIGVLSLLYLLSLSLDFKKLVALDVLLYGASLALEFVALIVLRAREPHRQRPFRIPGGMPGLVLLSLVPMCVIAFAGASILSGGEGAGTAVTLSVGVVVTGLLAYLLSRRFVSNAERTT